MARDVILKVSRWLLQVSILLSIAPRLVQSQLPAAHQVGNGVPPIQALPPALSTDSCGVEIKRGDLYVHCVSFKEGIPQRENARLTYASDIKSWGISRDATLLMLVRETADGSRILQRIDLRTGGTTKSESTDRRTTVQPTCGTVMMREFRTGAGYKFRDLADDREMSVPLATLDLRCSEDRRYVLRLSNQGELYLDSPKSVLLAKDIREFNISPDGSHIAYGGGDYLCAGTREDLENGKSSCLGMTWIAGPMIVLNNGSVLFTEQTSQACTVRVSGKDLSDPCPAIFSWRPGDPNDQLLSFNESDPHVISAEIGRAIINAHKKWKSVAD